MSLCIVVGHRSPWDLSRYVGVVHIGTLFHEFHNAILCFTRGDTHAVFLLNAVGRGVLNEKWFGILVSRATSLVCSVVAMSHWFICLDSAVVRHTI